MVGATATPTPILASAYFPTHRHEKHIFQSANDQLTRATRSHPPCVVQEVNYQDIALFHRRAHVYRVSGCLSGGAPDPK